MAARVLQQNRHWFTGPRVGLAPLALCVSVMLATSCNKGTSSGADAANSRGKKTSEQGETYGYLIPLEYFGYPDSYRPLFGPLHTSQLSSTSVDASYVMSIPIAESEVSDDIKLAIFRPNIGESCAAFNERLSSGELPDKNQRRFYLTLGSDLTFDAEQGGLLWVVAESNTLARCSAIVVADELPDDAANLGYRQLYGSVALAFAGAASDGNSNKANVRFLSSATGSFQDSVIEENVPTLPARMQMASLGSPGEFLLSLRGDRTYQRRQGVWDGPLSLSGSNDASIATGMGVDTRNGGEVSRILFDASGTVKMEERLTAGGAFDQFGGGYDFLQNETVTISSISGSRFARISQYMGGFGVGVFDLTDLSGAVGYGISELKDQASGNSCIEMRGSKIHYADNGDVHFAYACVRSGQPAGEARLHVGRLQPNNQHQIAHVLWDSDTSFATKDVSRDAAPSILVKNDGTAVFVYQGMAASRNLYLAELSDSGEAVTQSFPMSLSAASGLTWPTTAAMSAALDAAQGAVHIAFALKESTSVHHLFYGIHLLGTSAFSGQRLVEALPAPTLSTMIHTP